MKFRFLPFFLLLSSMSLQAATEVIPLSFRMAEDVLPIAQSVVGDQGKVNAYGNQLIVNAPSSVISELRDVLTQLDQEPRRLLISVDTQNSINSSEGGFGVDGSISAGKVEIGSGRGERNGRDQVRIIRHSTSGQGTGVQQVQATEGFPALIEVGQSVPLTTTTTDNYGQSYQQTEYRNVTRGFYATATVNGDRVQVTISSHNDRMNRSHSGVIDTQQTETRISGRLGEWISLGGLEEQANSNQTGTLRRYSTQSSQNTALRLKVDSLD